MKSIDYLEIGSRIREVRTMQKLTQEEASERCGITSSFYGNIERGDKKMSIDTLAKISTGLNVSTDELLFGKPDEVLTEADAFLKEMQRTVAQEQFSKFLTIMKAIASIINGL